MCRYPEKNVKNSSMLVNFCPHLQTPSIVCLFGWVLFLPQIFCERITCPPPDFPEGGGYKPVRKAYDVDQGIEYFCIIGLLHAHEKNESTFHGWTSTCNANGDWSSVTPFCDTPAELIDLDISSEELAAAVLDGDDATCSPTRNDTAETLRFGLDRGSEVYFARICWGEGNKKIKTQYGLYSTEDFSSDGNCTLEDYGKHPLKTDFFTVQISSATPSSLSVCTIEAYVKDDEWCLNPPEMLVPNGQLEVSRSRAILHCNVDFKEKEGRKLYATCRNNTWSYRRLECVDENGKQNEETFCGPVISNMSSTAGTWEKDGNSSKYTVGTKVALRCKRGYHSEGNPLSVTCLEDGTWTDSWATCQENTSEEGYHTSEDQIQKDMKIAIIVGAVILAFLFLLTLYLMRKKRFGVLSVAFRRGKNSKESA